MTADPTLPNVGRGKPFNHPVRPPVNAVFAGPLEMSRLLFPTTGCTPVVCVSCQTINRQSALICKGCEGRLPAFFSSNGEAQPGGSADVEPRSSIASLGRSAVARMGHWRTVTLTAATVLVLFAVFGIWYVSYLASTQPVDNSGTMASSTPDNVGSASGQPMGTTFLQTALAVAASLDETPAPRSTRTPVSTMAETDEQAFDRRPNAASTGAIGSRAVQARNVMTTAATNVSVRLRPAGDPLAACRSMGFFARAICLNDSCAQSRLSRHPQCAEVLAQQRVDEARRNPVMVN